MLASPLHRIEELISSKIQNANDPNIKPLIVEPDRTGYGSKEEEEQVKFVPLEKVKFGVKDTYKLVSRTHLTRNQIAQISV
jgi:hypothetical protein